MGKVSYLKVFAIIVAYFFVLIFGSMFIEVDRYRDEHETVQMFAKLAAEEAMMQQQDLFDAWNKLGSAEAGIESLKTYGVISPEAAEKLQDIYRPDLVGAISEESSQKYLCPGSIYLYTQEIDRQAKLAGLTEFRPKFEYDSFSDDLAYIAAVGNQTELYDDLRWLNKNSTIANQNYNPQQVGMTYAHAGVLEILFEDNMKRFIEDNYGLLSQNAASDGRIGCLRYLDAEVIIKPIIVDGATTYAQVEKLYDDITTSALYVELFGIPGYEEEILANGERKEGFYLYDAWDKFSVFYDIEFKVQTLHTMKTLIGQEGNLGSVYFGIYDREDTDKTTSNEKWTYISGQRYATLGMPVVSVEKRYSILH